MEEWGTIYGVKENEIKLVTVPAGTYEAATNYNYAILEGETEPAAGKDYSYLVDGVGEVFRTIGTVNNPISIYEKRLVNFSLIEE